MGYGNESEQDLESGMPLVAGIDPGDPVDRVGEDLVFPLTKLDLNSRCVFCIPLSHLVIRPHPFKGVCIAMIIFRP